MSVVNPESRAAPTRGAAFAYHRSSQLVEWLRRGNGVRLALSTVAGLCGVLIHDWGGGLIFPFTPAISLTAGLLFGWLGIAGTIAGQFLGIWITRDDPANAFVLALSFALAGATGWAIFHYVPKLGRGLPNLRSFLWTLGAGVVGGLSGSALSLAFSGPAGQAAGRWSAALWVWAWGTGALVSVVLLAPPILLLFDRYGRRWMVPIPDEFRGEDRQRDGAIPGSGEETVIVFSAPVSSARKGLRGLLLGSSMVLAAAAVSLSLIWLLPRGIEWTPLVYLLPILWAALRYGLRGGILAASGSGICHLMGLAGLAMLALAIFAGLKAQEGKLLRYPINFRLIK